MRVLDAGCGNNKLPGAIGVDIRRGTAADVIHDLGLFPYPFKDGVFEQIYCLSAIEHLPDLVGVMNEFHRISRPGGRLHIQTPHFSSVYSWSDPTHRHHLSSRSFLSFTDHPGRGGVYTDRRFRIVEQRFIFGRSLISLIPRLLARISPWHYEKHFAFVFPANDIYFELEVLK